MRWSIATRLAVGGMLVWGLAPASAIAGASVGPTARVHVPLPAVAQGTSCDISGTWRHHPEATWTFTRMPGGSYVGEEQGLGNALGSALLSGSTLRIEYATRDGSIQGFYEFTMAPDCNSAQGRVEDSRGARAEVTMVRLSGPSGNPGGGAGSGAGSGAGQGAGGLVVAASDADPANQLFTCEGARARLGSNAGDQSVCLTFRYATPPGGVHSALLHLDIQPLDPSTDALIVATSRPFDNCTWGQGRMAGCIGLLGGPLPAGPTLEVDLFNVVGLDRNWNNTAEGQQAVLEQLNSGVLHVVVQDDTIVHCAQLVLNGGDGTPRCDRANPNPPRPGGAGGGERPPPVVAGGAQLGWLGMDTDQVGSGAAGGPDGRNDGHFRLALVLPPRSEIVDIVLYSADASGTPAGGQIWHSRDGCCWILGVVATGQRLNPAYAPSLGTFTGPTSFDLYASDSGWFKDGNYFLAEATLAGGQTLRGLVQIGATAPLPPTGGDSGGASGRCDLTGRWTSLVSGVLELTWTFSPGGAETYAARVEEFPDVMGTARVVGNQLRLTFTSTEQDIAGLYEATLAPDCASAAGTWQSTGFGGTVSVTGEATLVRAR